MPSGGSTEVASGYVSLYARMDAGQLVSEVTDALSGLNAASLASGVLNGIGSAAQSLGTRLTVLGGIAAVGATKLANSLFDVISNAENTSIALETMLGSTDLAAEAMDRLNEFAIKTPYEFSNIATSSKQLLAMGIDFDKQLDASGSGILKWAGNWAAALGLNDAGFSNVLTQFGHINAAGRVYTRNITALSRNGIAAWQALSDYMGISIDEVRGLVQKGEVDAETALAAFESYANEHFLGTMGRMAHTMSGIMSNINDAIKVPIMALKDTSAYTNLTNAMYELTDPLRELVEALMPSVEKIFERVTPLVEGFTDKIVEMTDSLKKGNPDDLVRGLEAIAMVLGSGPLLKGFGLLSSGLGGFLGMASGFGKGVVSYVAQPLSALSKSLQGKSVFGIVGSYFSSLGSKLSTIGSLTKELVLNAAGSLGTVAGTMKGALSWVGPLFSETFGVVRGEIGNLAPLLSSGVARIGSTLASAGSKTTRFFGDFFASMGSTSVGEFLASVGSTLPEGFAAMGGSLKEVGAFVSAGFGNMFGDAVTALTEDMPDYGRRLKAFFSPFFGEYGDVLLNEAGLGKIPAILGSVVNSVRSRVPAIFGAVKTYGQPVLKGVVDGLSVMASGLVSTFGPAVGAVRTVLSGFVTVATNLGGVVKQVAKPFANLFGATLKTGISTFSQFAAVLTKGGAAFGVVALGATLAAGVFAAMGGDLSSLGAEIADVLGSVGGTAADALSSFATGLSTLAESGGIEQFFMSITSGINGFVSQVAAQVPAVLAAIGEAFPQVMSGLIGMFTTYAPMVASGAMQLFAGLVTGLTGVIEQLTPALPEMVSGIATAIAENAPAILDAGVGLFTALVDAFVTTIPAVLGELPNLVNSLITSLVANFPTIMAGATRLFNAIAEAIPVIVPLAISALTRLLSSLVRSFPTWGPQFLTAMGNVLNSLLNAIANAIPMAVEAIKSLLRQGMNAIRSTNWAELGSNLIKGFINGIKNMASAVVSAATSVVSGAVSAVKGFLGIASPSKLFRGFGEMTMAGLALGIDDGAGGVLDAMGSVMDDMLPSAIPASAIGTYTGVRGAAFGGVTNHYYIDGHQTDVDAILASALDTVASRVSGRARMGVVRG